MVGVGGGGWLGLVVVVYHVTIIANGHGVLKKVSPFGNRMRSTHCREFLYMKLCSPAYYARTTQCLVLYLGMCFVLPLLARGGGVGGELYLICILSLGFSNNLYLRSSCTIRCVQWLAIKRTKEQRNHLLVKLSHPAAAPYPVQEHAYSSKSWRGSHNLIAKVKS